MSKLDKLRKLAEAADAGEVWTKFQSAATPATALKLLEMVRIGRAALDRVGNSSPTDSVEQNICADALAKLGEIERSLGE